MHHSKAGWRKATPAQVTKTKTVEEAALDILARLDDLFFSMGHDQDDQAIKLANITDDLEELFYDEEIVREV